MTPADAYFAHHEAIVYNEIRKPLSKLRDECGGRREVARILGWKLSYVNEVLDSPPLPEIACSPMQDLTEQDLRRNSFMELRHIVRCAVVESLEHLGTTLNPTRQLKGDEGKRAIARFLDVDDSFVRRVMDRPEYGRHMSLGDLRKAPRTTNGQDPQPDPEETQ